MDVIVTPRYVAATLPALSILLPIRMLRPLRYINTGGSMTRVYTLVPLFLIIALGAGGVAARPGRAPRAAVRTSADDGIRECPEAHRVDTSSVEQLLTSGTAGIPEYNDCQRFIVNGRFESLS